MTLVDVSRKRLRPRKWLRVTICTIALAAAIILAVWLFLMLVLQGSFQTEPATAEEILQMNFVERWFFLK